MDTQSALELARGEIQKGDNRKARDILREAAKIDPNNESIYMLYAQVADTKENAIKALKYALKINPNNEQAQKWLNQLQPQPYEEGNELNYEPTYEEPHRETGYLESNLMPDEKIIYKAKLHWGVFINPSIFAFLVLLFFVCPVASMPLLDIEDNQSLGICGWVVAIVVLILIGYLARAAIRYFSTEFVLTNKRILHKVGWIRRKSFELVLTHVEGIGIDQSAIARALGYGTLVISGSGGSKQSLRNMANPHEFRKRVYSQIQA